MNWVTILGIIIIAVGTLLTTYGSSLSNKSDKTDITEKLESFNESLDEIKNGNLPKPEKEEKIKKLEGEFGDWAEQFSKSKEQHKIAFDKREMKLRERKAKLNEEWHKLYEDFFKSLTEMINALNEVSNSSISFVKNPPMPKNIYDASDDKFKVVLKFDENNYWIIYLIVQQPVKKDEIPGIGIMMSDEPNPRFRAINSLHMHMDLELRSMFVLTDENFEKAGFETKYELKSDENKTIDILKKAIEYQVLLLNK